MQLPFGRPSDEMRAILDRAQREAAARHNPYVDVEHILLGLFYRPEGPVRDLFRRYGLNAQEYYDAVADTVGVVHLDEIALKGYSRAAQAVLERAAREAQFMGHHVPGAGHLLLALLDTTNGPVPAPLDRLPFNAETVRTATKDAGAPRVTVATPNTFVPTGTKAPRQAASQPAPSGKPEFVLIPTRRKSPTKPGTTGSRLSRPAWLDRVGYLPWLVAALVALVVYMVLVLPGDKIFVFTFVLIGWIFSVTLHEFAHAAVAYMGGDYTVKDKGYLSFNPLKYTHPMLSIGLPLLFLAMGGIGLPGGAVYIEKHRLRSKHWSSAVSAAGPAANLVLAFVLAIPFLLGLVNTRAILISYVYGVPASGSGIWGNTSLWAGMAFLIMLQITAVFFNLIPIPPLDGYGILEPYLDERTRMQLAQFGMLGLFLIFMAFWYIPPLNKAFWDGVYQVTNWINVPDWLITIGNNLFMFWRK